MRGDPISSLMHSPVLSIGMDESLQAAEAFMDTRGLSWAPVVSNAREAVGVLSLDDLVRFRANNRDAGNTPVWRMCTYKPVCVNPETTIAEVARLMVERKIHHVVINEGGDIKGVVSSLDLLKRLI
jgi:CBS domain-containing protein